MNRLWWKQIRAVIRLEMKKTFFAKRGIWIYLLALAPLVLFAGHAIETARHRQALVRLISQNEKPLAEQDFAAITPGMAQEEVVERLGNPPVRNSWKARRRTGPDSIDVFMREQYHYGAGQSEFFVEIEHGKVAAIHRRQEGCDFGQDSIIFASVFQFFYLRLAIFFGCLGIFMNLFRGELLDKSLHFYFLAPIRREIVMIGKYLAGLIAATIIFTTSTALQMVALGWHFDPNALSTYLYQNHGLAHATAYLGVTALACLGYGSFFLAAGLLFRNPIWPAAAILLWEGLNPFLPSLLKKLSVIYYLKSLCPVEIPVGPGVPPVFALLVSNADPIAAPLAVFGVITVALAILLASSYQVRRMEINYTTE
ncbi:MAG TPA: hypothetical protein VOA41_09875 [Candidatus Dormibacteraeota bacterium]|nr:hypothetical protein [Candidatus Dormibacteraeota bacterium]